MQTQKIMTYEWRTSQEIAQSILKRIWNSMLLILPFFTEHVLLQNIDQAEIAKQN